MVTIHGNIRLVAKVTRARPFSFWWNAARLETFTIPRSRGGVCITNYTREAVMDLAKKTWVVPIRDPEALAQAALKWWPRIRAGERAGGFYELKERLSFRHFEQNFIGRLSQLGIRSQPK